MLLKLKDKTRNHIYLYVYNEGSTTHLEINTVCFFREEQPVFLKLEESNKSDFQFPYNKEKTKIIKVFFENKIGWVDKRLFEEL